MIYFDLINLLNHVLKTWFRTCHTYFRLRRKLSYPLSRKGGKDSDDLNNDLKDKVPMLYLTISDWARRMNPSSSLPTYESHVVDGTPVHPGLIISSILVFCCPMRVQGSSVASIDDHTPSSCPRKSCSAWFPLLGCFQGVSEDGNRSIGPFFQVSSRLPWIRVIRPETQSFLRVWYRLRGRSSARVG